MIRMLAVVASWAERKNYLPALERRNPAVNLIDSYRKKARVALSKERDMRMQLTIPPTRPG